MKSQHRSVHKAFGTRALPWLLGLVAVAGACYPSGVDSITDYNTVTTAYDTTFDFTALSTFSIPSTVPNDPSTCVIKDLSTDGGPINSPNASAICTTIVTQLTSRGYTNISDDSPTPPSFFVTVSGMSQSYNAWVSYPWYGYYGSYYPGYYPWTGWGVYYPYYTYVYTYDVGTIAIQVTTADTAGGKMNGVWGAALNGVDTAPNNTAPVLQAGVVQAFNQSPYFTK
jgi:hypothetical protein